MSWNFKWDKTAVCIGIAGVTILAVRRAFLHLTASCPSKALMVGKTVIVTGANCGIGYQTALEMAKRKAKVILACRNMAKAEAAAERIRKITGNKDVLVKKLNLASLKSVREFCVDISRTQKCVDVLINNAGVMNCPFAITEDGFETHVAVNHLGNFLLTNLLREDLSKAPLGRVIFVSSSLHRFGSVHLEDLNTEEGYKKGKPYADTKLMNLLFAREFHRRYAREGNLCVYSLHPGMVKTSLARHSIIFSTPFKILCFPLYLLLNSLFVLLTKTAKEGCQTVVYCAVAEELTQSDGYYGNCKKELWSGPACDLEMAKLVWDYSAEKTYLES